MTHQRPTTLTTIAHNYLSAIERGAPFEELGEFLTDDCVQEEFPNRLMPNGARRTVADLRAAGERGKKAVEGQRFEVLAAVEQGDRVALEIQWSARVLLPFGSLKAGDEMRARFAFFLEFRDDRIASQHNYDCFDPF